MNQIYTFAYVYTRYLALGPRFGLVLVAQVKGFGSRGSFWADFDIFEILGEAGDINSLRSMRKYCNGLSLDLGLYVNKLSSACG